MVAPNPQPGIKLSVSPACAVFCGMTQSSDGGDRSAALRKGRLALRSFLHPSPRIRRKRLRKKRAAGLFPSADRRGSRRKNTLRILRELRKMGVRIDSCGGFAPVQAEGRLADGKTFYFRARGDGWRVEIGDGGPTPVWVCRRQYDKPWPAAGFMGIDETVLYIKGGIMAYQGWLRRGSPADEATGHGWIGDAERRADAIDAVFGVLGGICLDETESW